jgi:hypothetical protein
MRRDGNHANHANHGNHAKDGGVSGGAPSLARGGAKFWRTFRIVNLARRFTCLNTIHFMNPQSFRTTRRSFLKGMAITTGGIVMPNLLLRAEDNVPASRKLGIAAIGCRREGRVRSRRGGQGK